MATEVSALHAPSAKLEDLAATAALYVKKHDRNAASNQNSYLDEEDKLSSAGEQQLHYLRADKRMPLIP